MNTINRFAVVIKPKQPFVDWLHSVDADSRDITLEDVMEDSSVYLLPQRDYEDDMLEVLRMTSREIFSQELAAWFEDLEIWPRDLSFGAFRRWFEFEIHSMVIDLSDEPLLHDMA
jgi:hypothetical protein